MLLNINLLTTAFFILCSSIINVNVHAAGGHSVAGGILRPVIFGQPFDLLGGGNYGANYGLNGWNYGNNGWYFGNYGSWNYGRK